MDPITNSTIKENIRQYNYARIKPVVDAIETDLRNKINARQLISSTGPCIALMIILGGICCGIGALFKMPSLGSLIGGLTGWGLGYLLVKKINDNIYRKNEKLKAEAYAAIQKEYDIADQLTMKAIADYDNEVNKYAGKIMASPSAISSITNHTLNMFRRMISHADSGSYVKFIEAELTFEVSETLIRYYYQSSYANTQDDFDFQTNRFKPLKSDTECEGLAQAISKLVIAEMKKQYPPNSMKISLSHNDAKVTLHFKAVNKNFVPAKNIV